MSVYLVRVEVEYATMFIKMIIRSCLYETPTELHLFDIREVRNFHALKLSGCQQLNTDLFQTGAYELLIEKLLQKNVNAQG